LIDLANSGGKQMKCSSIRAVAFLFGIAMFVCAAMAARALTSTLVVQILSVDQESFRRGPAMMSQGRPFGDQWLESTGYVAKAQIQNVIRSDHGLAPGEIIEIHYEIRTATPQPLPFTDARLKPGQSGTLTVSKAKSGYSWTCLVNPKNKCYLD